MPISKITLQQIPDGKYFSINDYNIPEGLVCGFPSLTDNWQLELAESSLRYMAELGEGDEVIDIRVSRINYYVDSDVGVRVPIHSSIVLGSIPKVGVNHAKLSKVITQLIRKSFKQEFTIKQIKPPKSLEPQKDYITSIINQLPRVL